MAQVGLSLVTTGRMWRDDDASAAPADQIEQRDRRSIAMRKRLMLPLLLTGAVGVAGGVAWLYRTPLVTQYVDRTLTEKGVAARYTLEQVGFRTQKLRNVSIGDPRNPDLTAREITIEVTVGLAGPKITRVRARGVRLKGRWLGDRLSLGQLDRLMPADDGTPFALPDMAVDLADSSAVISTPWGTSFLAAAGHGHLRDGFDGHVAVRAPQLAAAGCTTRGVSGNLRVTMRSMVPTISGPVGLFGLSCPQQALALGEMRLGVRGTIKTDLSDWSFDSGVRGADALIETSGWQGLTGTIKARRGDGGGAKAEWQLTATDAAIPWLTARTLRLDGQGELAANSDATATGRVTLTGGRASPATLRQAGNLERYGPSTPIAPLAGKLGQALRRAGQSVEAASDYTASRDAAGRMRLTLGDPQARAATGAEVAFVGASAIGWDSVSGISLDTVARVGGGDLPQGTVALQRGGTGQALTGEARFVPYSAGNAALALAPLRFVAASDGSARFSTGIALTGPLAGGAVDRLAVPLAGQIDGDGSLVISGECRDLSWYGIATGSVAIDRDRMRLCGRGGAPLLRVGPQGISGGADLPAFDLSGRAGSSPLRIASGGGFLRLGDGAFELRDVETSIGSGESATRFSAARLAGTQDANGLVGVMTAATGKIGPVPVLLSDGNGRWRYDGGRLTLDATLAVDDAALDDRFHTMRADSVALTLENGRIGVTGLLREAETGVTIADLSIRHDLSSNVGDARFTVPGLQFSRAGLQPAQLSNLALGVIASAEGLVTGGGEIAWDGNGVRSRGSFSTDRLDFAAAFGPVERLSGRMEFDDLIALSTPPGQEVRLGSVNPGIEVTDGRLLYQLLPGQQVRIEGGSWPFAGGQLRLQPALLDFGADVPRRLTFDVAGVDAGLFLQRFEFENISATGIFYGVLPTVFDQDGGRVEGGSLVSRSGGTLAYVGELSNRDLGTYANLAFGALRSLKYDSLTIRMNGRIDGEMLTEVDFTGLGQGQGANRNILTRSIERLPFTFSIRINAPFRQLLSSARGLFDPTTLIEQNLPALIRADRDARERAAQPAASGDTGTEGPQPAAPGNARPRTTGPITAGPITTGEAGMPVQPRESEDRP